MKWNKKSYYFLGLFSGIIIFGFLLLVYLNKDKCSGFDSESCPYYCKTKQGEICSDIPLGGGDPKCWSINYCTSLFN
jgi:hypothetical protein